MSNVLASMDVSQTAQASKNLMGFRKMAGMFGYTIVDPSGVDAWKIYSYVSYGACKEAELAPPAAKQDGCAQQ